MPDLSQHDLEFHCYTNVFYHQGAERRCSMMLNLTAFASVILSSTAFAAIGDLLPSTAVLSPSQVVALATFLVTCLNAMVLAFGIFQTHTRHWQIKQKWLQLLSDVRRPGEADLDGFITRFNAINAEEPSPNKRRLNLAYQEACVAMGLDPIEEVQP